MKSAGNKQPKNEPGSPSTGDMQLYRLSGTLNKVATKLLIFVNIKPYANVAFMYRL